MSAKEKELQRLVGEVKSKSKIKNRLRVDLKKYEEENIEAVKKKQKALDHSHKMEARQRSLRKEIKEQSQARAESSIVHLKLKYLTDKLKDFESKIKSEQEQI